MKKKVGIIIIFAVLIFSFVVPLFYPYGQTEIFYYQKDSAFSYAFAEIRNDYLLYKTNPNFTFPKDFDSQVEMYVQEAIINGGEHTTEEGFVLKETANGVYSVEVLPESIYGRLEYLDDSFDGVVGVVTFYTINFYDMSKSAEYSSDNQYIANLLLTADSELNVYDEHGNTVGQLSQYVFRSDNGEDIFTIEQKNELRILLYENTVLQSDKRTTLYSDTLKREIQSEKHGSSVTIFQHEVKNFIDTYASPSKKHILGTDSNGMDVLARLMCGGRVSLFIGFTAAILCAILGVVIGCISGICGGVIDGIIMRFIDVLNCIPIFPILVIFGSIMASVSRSQGVRCLLIILIFAVMSWTEIARNVRSQLLYLKEKTSSIAAESSHIPVYRRVIFHMLPEAMPQIIASIAISISGFIISESSISFLGLGVKFPYATWGAMISENCSINELGAYPSIWISTGIMICLTSIGFHILGDSLICKINSKGRVVKTKAQCKNVCDCELSKDEILRVDNLKILFYNKNETVEAISDLSFSINKGEIIAVLGDSGSGKTAMEESILGLLPYNADVLGSVLLRDNNGKVVDVLNCSKEQLRYVRGKTLGYIMQEPCSCFDPVIKIGKQIEESIKNKEHEITAAEAKNKTFELLKRVGFENDCEKIYSSYPGELSGGQCQRIMIASVLAQTPSVIIADETCNSLDMCSKSAVLKLLKSASEAGTSVIYITHDVNEAKYLTDNIIFIDSGHVVPYESQPKDDDLKPCRYTKKEYEKFISISTASKTFKCINVSIFNKHKHLIKAVDDVSFDIGKGECVALIGSVGSGKTTLAKIVDGVMVADYGTMYMDDKKYNLSDREIRKKLGCDIQMIFQNPYDSLTKTMTVGEQIREVVHVNKIVSKSSEREYVCGIMRLCGLDDTYYSRYPDTLSGGQCQRVCIARAVAVKPKLLICDEPLSALDANMHSHIVELLCKLKDENNLSILYITHEVNSLRYIADRVIVMDNGKLISSHYMEKLFSSDFNSDCCKIIQSYREFI